MLPHDWSSSGAPDWLVSGGDPPAPQDHRANDRQAQAIAAGPYNLQTL
jgi:hypothetical protein